jgi:hypothetical protein
MMNFLMQQVGEISGFPQAVPYPDTPIVQDFGAKMFHNVHVSNSTIGVVNTGNIESVDVAITALRNHGSANVAEAFRNLSQALLDSTDVPRATRDEALQLLDAIASESVLPAERRRAAVARPLLTRLKEIVGPIASLTDFASKYIPMIVAYFAS